MVAAFGGLQIKPSSSGAICRFGWLPEHNSCPRLDSPLFSSTKTETLTESDSDSAKTELNRLKLQMNEVARSMDDAESRAEQAEREIEELKARIKSSDDNDDVQNLLNDGSIEAVLQEANEAIEAARKAVEVTEKKAEETLEEAINAARMEAESAAREKALEEQIRRANIEMESRLAMMEEQKKELLENAKLQSDEKATRIADLEAKIEAERFATKQAEERARQQLKEAEMKAQEVQVQLREQEKQKETELQLLRQRLEDAVVKQEKMQARVLALKSAKRDVQDAMMDRITSLQAELKTYEENFIKLQKETDERYEAKLKDYRLQAKDELEERLAYQEEQTQKVRSDLIKNHQDAIDRIYGKLDKARGTISKLQQALEETKKESREKIAALVKENADRMEALVNQYESEKEAMIKEFSETLNSQDDAIEELQDLNAALSCSFQAAKESHKNEIKMINKQYQQQLLADKAESERNRANLLERHATVVAEKNSKILYYEDERSSIRKMLKQTIKVFGGRAKTRLERIAPKPRDQDENDDSTKQRNAPGFVISETEPLS